MAANSDYFPVLDLNAARHRFTEKSATDVVALLNLPVPVLEMLEPAHSRRPVNPLYKGASAFERVENTRSPYARVFPARCGAEPKTFQRRCKRTSGGQVHLIECRNPRDRRLAALAAQRGADGESLPERGQNRSGLGAHRARAIPCFRGCTTSNRGSRYYAPVGQSNAVRMAELGGVLLCEPVAANNEEPRIPVAGGADRVRGRPANGEARRGVLCRDLADAVQQAGFDCCGCRAEPENCAGAFKDR